MAPVAVFAGRFASQPLVFAHLLDAADGAGLALDLDHVEAICGGLPDKRLAHVFNPGDVAAIKAAQGTDDTLVLIFPEALVPGARLFETTPHLRPLGLFHPTRPRLRA